MTSRKLAFDIATGNCLGEDLRSKALAQRADCTQGTDGETCLVSLGRFYEQSKVLLDIYQQEKERVSHLLVSPLLALPSSTLSSTNKAANLKKVIHFMHSME